MRGDDKFFNLGMLELIRLGETDLIVFVGRGKFTPGMVELMLIIRKLWLRREKS